MNLIHLLLITLLPWIECRGSIPLAIAYNFSLLSLIPIVLTNIMIFPITYFVLEFFYEKFLSKIRIVKTLIKRIRKSGKSLIEKYEYLGLLIFVAIPLPFTGMYSGTILAWLLGMKFKKSFFYASIGVIIACAIVTSISLGAEKIISLI